MLPSLAFAQNKLIFNTLIYFAKAVKAKTNDMECARAREGVPFFPLRRQIDISALEVEMPTSEVVLRTSRRVALPFAPCSTAMEKDKRNGRQKFLSANSGQQRRLWGETGFISSE